MATILRMKMAGPSINSTAQRFVRPSLQSGRRSYAVSTQSNHFTNHGISQRQVKVKVEGIRSTPLLTHHLHYRSISQSMALLSSSPATQMDPDSEYQELISQSTSTSSTISETDRVPPNSNHLPKQSSHVSGILFSTIGPHLEQRTLNQLTKKLTRIVSRGHHKMDSQDRDGKKSTLKRRLDMLFAPREGKQNSDESAGVKYSWSVKGHPWIQQTMYSYLTGDLLEKPYLEGANPPPYQEDPMYPPNQNRQQYQKHLNTLIKAREVSLHHPIFWTEKLMRESGFTFGTGSSEEQVKYQEKLMKLHSPKSDAQLQSEAEELLDKLVSSLPPPHFHKIMGTLERYAKLDTTLGPTSEEPKGGQKNDANSWYIDDSRDNSSPLPALPESGSSKSGWRKHRIPILGKTLVSCSSSHSHLVALDLGQYFYMDFLDKSTGEGKDPMVLPNISALAIRKHRKLFSVKKKYNKSRDEFVNKMMQLQHDFATWETADPEEIESNNDESIEGDDDDDVSSDFLVGEFEKAQKPYSLDSRKEQQEDLEETLVELRRMGLRHDKDAAEKRGRGRPKKGIHLKFSAIRLKEEDESPELTATVEAESEERVVFINNLPIDTTEAEIDEIYSRCGPLESIQLFNLRPDLDPGPLSNRQLQERRRKKPRTKHAFASYNEFKHQRPRTPVYGMLRFKSAQGYQVATSPELCIFGCVIRRHPVLSIKHQDNTTLHLEKIPDNTYSMDVEVKLAQLLHPHNVHVMLDGMNGVGMNGSGSGETDQGFNKPASCQVNFEDFHTASQAYQWLREGEGEDGNAEEKAQTTIAFKAGEETQVHWFRTPENSMKYWTRELIF